MGGGKHVSAPAVLWGACDPLVVAATARPARRHRAASSTRSVGELLRSGERDGLFDATLAALEDGGPTVLVLEDLHWADVSTLDLLRFLSAGGCRQTRHRGRHLPRRAPRGLRSAAGDDRRHRLDCRASAAYAVPLLSPRRWPSSAAGSRIDPSGVSSRDRRQRLLRHRGARLGGDQLPATVQDAVLAASTGSRRKRGSPSRRPPSSAPRIEPTLVHGLPDVTPTRSTSA